MENEWIQRVEELEAEVAKLTTALKDKPDQSDLDAAVFRINHLEAENKRLRMYRDAAESRAQGLEVERDAAVKWLEEYKSKTYCAYCGAIFNIDSDASHVSEHIRTCPHHPMRELEAENKRLREALERIAAYDSYHSEWPTEIWINAPPEELAHVILSGGKYPPQQTHVGGKL